MSVEEELKKDHADMQAIVDSKQKIIEAQVIIKHQISPVYSSTHWILAATWVEFVFRGFRSRCFFFILNECLQQINCVVGD